MCSSPGLRAASQPGTHELALAPSRDVARKLWRVVLFLARIAGLARWTRFHGKKLGPVNRAGWPGCHLIAKLISANWVILVMRAGPSSCNPPLTPSDSWKLNTIWQVISISSIGICLAVKVLVDRFLYSSILSCWFFSNLRPGNVKSSTGASTSKSAIFSQIQRIIDGCSVDNLYNHCVPTVQLFLLYVFQHVVGGLNLFIAYRNKQYSLVILSCTRL